MTDAPIPRRSGLPRWRILAAGGAVVGLGIAALMALQDPAPEPSRFIVTNGAEPTAVAKMDPLQAALLRCRDLPAGSDDAACREAWEVNRRRFLGESRSFVPPVDAANQAAKALPSPAAERP